MNLFGEPSLEIEGVDFICVRQFGRSLRHYRRECAYCGAIIFKRTDHGKISGVYFCNHTCYGQHLSGQNENLSNEIQTLRKTYEYEKWRKAVYKRDDYTCYDCSAYGGHLEAHHIDKVSLFPEKIFDVDNGVTMCVPCHKLIRGKEQEFKERYLECLVPI